MILLNWLGQPSAGTPVAEEPPSTSEIIVKAHPNRVFGRRAAAIINALDTSQHSTIIDIGCGIGRFEAMLLQFGMGNIVGLDIDAKSLLRAKIIRSRRVHFVCGDAQHLPFRTRSVEYMIAPEVLEHLEDDNRALREIARILRNGSAVISVPHAKYPFSWDPVNYLLQRLCGVHVPASMPMVAGVWAKHRRLYTEDELTAKIERAGMRVSNIWRNTFVCVPFLSFSSVLLSGFASRFGRAYLSMSNVNSGSKFLQLLMLPIAFLDRLNDRIVKGDSFVGIIITAKKDSGEGPSEL